MKNFRTVCVLAMVISMALCGSVFAADDVRTAITSEPIPDRAESCEKYGAITFTFQENTTIQDGDQIQIDLPQNVNVCHNQDFVVLGSIPVGSVPSPTFGTLKATGPQAPGSAEIVIGAWKMRGISGSGGWELVVTGTGTGLYARVQTVGTTPPNYADGARKMLVTFYDDDAAPVGTPNSFNNVVNYNRSTTLTVAPNTQLTLTIFNGEPYNTQPLALKDASAPKDAVFETRLQLTTADIFDNYLCGWYTTVYTNELINVSFDSRNVFPTNPEEDIFTFQGQREIAHKIGAQQVVMQQCYKPRDLCGFVAPLGGQTASCSYTYWPAAGYCTDQGTANFTKAGGNRVILQSTAGFFDSASDYILVLEVTTTNATAAAVGGTFFGANPALYSYLATAQNDLCTIPNAAGATTIFPAFWTKTASNGSTAGSFWSGVGCAGVPANDAIVKLASDRFKLPIGSNRLIVDFGNFVYLKDVVAFAGYTANVKVTLQKAPCGTIMTGNRCVAQYMPICAATSPTTTLLFPYTTPLDQSSGWWFGMSFCNPTSTAGEAKITVYEADGDVGTYTEPTVRAYGMVTYPDLTLLSMLTPKAGNTGTLGDDRAHIVVECKFGSAGGFGMMGNGIDSTGYSAYGNSTAWNY